jgi:hypothetical protein
MITARRIWLTAQEVALLFFCSILALAGSGVIGIVFDSPFAVLLPFFALIGLLLYLLFRLRKKHRPAKILYSAAKYDRSRALAKSFPRRAAWIKLVTRLTVSLPSALAAFVLFFFPMASHVFQPGGTHLGFYWVPIPWNIIILSGRVYGDAHAAMAYTSVEENPLGLTRHILSNRFSAGMDFIARAAVPANEPLFRRVLPTREFRLGMQILACWDSPIHYRSLREIHCDTSGPGQLSLHASFLGAPNRVPVFYRILSRIRTDPE